VTTANRSTKPGMADLQEEGVKDVVTSNWTALLAPKGTPQPIIDKLNAEVVKILNDPEVKDRFAGGGVVTRSARRTRGPHRARSYRAITSADIKAE
jgi:tripartite-type tricarboxylate transporter receptor subunit TctC